MSLFVTHQVEQGANGGIDDALKENCPEHLVDTPLLKQFYQQLRNNLRLAAGQRITKEQLEKEFPEFEIMGKTALDKWLKHLVELELLVKPNARKKEYMLPASIG